MNIATGAMFTDALALITFITIRKRVINFLVGFKTRLLVIWNDIYDLQKLPKKYSTYMPTTKKVMN